MASTLHVLFFSKILVILLKMHVLFGQLGHVILKNVLATLVLDHIIFFLLYTSTSVYFFSVKFIYHYGLVVLMQYQSVAHAT